MANLFPSIFPYAPDSPEMKKLGMQTEFEVYTKLGSTYDETVDILCEPKFIKRDYFGRMRDGEYTDFIILHPQKGIIFLECKGGLLTYNAKEGKWYQEGDGGAFYVKVYEDDGGMPGAEVYSQVVAGGLFAGWNDKDLLENGWTVSGDFWI